MSWLGLGPDRPLSSIPEFRTFIDALIDIDAQDDLYSIEYAATEYFITSPDDDPPNQPFHGTLKAGLRIDESIVTSGGYYGFVLNVSEFTLDNSEGLYDALADQNSINGQQIVIRVGESGTALNSHEVIATLHGERWRASRKSLVCDVRDTSSALDVPVQSSIYTGTGDLEGGPEIANKRRPYGDGSVFNASPTLVIGAEGLWQCNDGEVEEITAVRDGGIELTLHDDYDTVAQLRAAVGSGDIPPGYYGTCVAEGYFCLGSASFKQITCDFSGINNTTADIIRAVAVSSAGLEDSDIDEWTFNELNDIQPAPVNYYLDSESSETCREMFDNLMRGIGGFAGMTSLGKLKVGLFREPIEVAAQRYDVVGGNVVDIDRVNLPEALDPPPRRRRVPYARNWTQQTDLFGQVSEDDPEFAAYLGRPYKLTSTSDDEASAVVADYPFAPDPNPVDAYFTDEDDAQAEADRLHAFDVGGFKAYRCVLKNALRMHTVGQVIYIKDSSIRPRLSLSTGKYLRVVSVSDDFGSGQTEIVGVG